VLAVLGTGVQARAHVEALRHVRGIKEVRVWGRTREHAERCARDVVGTAMAADAAVRGAQIVVTATGTSEPVLHGAWLAEGACVLTIGGYGRTRRELDDDAMRGTVVVDSREAALEESGDVIQSRAPIAAEIGEVLAGSKTLPASHHVVFKSNGLAAEDVAAGALVWRATASP
jgi:thiomorpholine-carboxylate dehydrogenase